jgi:phosphoglycolate phosphatase
MPEGILFFDLDGTLTDPRPGIVGSIQHALRELGRPVPPEEDLLWCIGPPLKASFETLLEGAGDVDRAVTLYRERFSDVGLFENRVYDGVPELLEALEGQGFELHVATSKPYVFAERIVRHFGLDRYLRSVFGAELTGERTDKGELLAHALVSCAAAPEAVTMIGDRSHDMVGARKNAIRAVGVLYGYGSRAELLDAGADALAGSPDELVDVLGR